MGRAYVVGCLQREKPGGPLVLISVEVRSASSAMLTSMDGIYWCDFGEPFTGEDFKEAMAKAEQYAVSKRHWLRLKG